MGRGMGMGGGRGRGVQVVSQAAPTGGPSSGATGKKEEIAALKEKGRSPEKTDGADHGSRRRTRRRGVMELSVVIPGEGG